MPWKTIDISTLSPAAAAPPSAEPQFAPPEKNVGGIRDFFTGENRTEFPDVPEFHTEYLKSYKPTSITPSAPLAAINQSAISSDPKAQLDILRKAIPGLQARPDKYGNVMVKTPEMAQFTYLNKPGATRRDFEEFATQTGAALPYLSVANMGKTLGTKLLAGATGLGAASVTEDLLAGAVGSEQGIDPTKAAISAGLGAAGAGVVEPILGKGLQALGKAAATPINRVRAAIDPKAEAQRRIVGAGAEDARNAGLGMTANQVATARARGQDPRVIDAGGEMVRAEARRAANIAPTARKEFTDFTQDRFLGQSERYSEFISQLVRRQNAPGLPPNAYATREALQTAGRASTNARYTPAYAAGARGVQTPLLQQLQTAPAVQAAMRRANTEMKNRVAGGRSTGMRGPNGPTLEYWDLVKRRLDDRIQSLKRAGANSEALDLDTIRVQLLKELDRIVPEYAAARGTAESFFKSRDALEAGENFVTGKYDLGKARAALAKMTAAERDLFAEGFASRYIEGINRVSDRRSILNSLGASRDARERLNIALGSNRARAVESFLRAEGLMDLARSAMGNSTTARQLMELGLGGYGLYSNDPQALMLAGLSFGSRHIGHQIDRRVAEQLVKQLLSPDVATFTSAVKKIASSPMLDALRAFDRLVQRAGIGKSAGTSAAADALALPSPEVAPAANLPAGAPGGPLLGPPSRPGLPPPNSGPSNPLPSPGSVSNNKDLRASNSSVEEVYRLAREAIAQGADPAAVKARLAEYGIVPEGLG